MSHPANTPAVEAAAVVTLHERQTAVATWLLAATDDRMGGWNQWADQGLALLSCGGIFSAVRAPASLVWKAAGTDDLPAVDAYLQRWFNGGAVFMDVTTSAYYFLVRATFAWRFHDRRYPGVEVLGRDHFLGVPAPRLTEPFPRSYWCVPMDGPGELCMGDEVEQLLRMGLARGGEGE